MTVKFTLYEEILTFSKTLNLLKICAWRL